MILAIDVGNSNIVLGCIEDGVIGNISRIRTSRQATEMEYAIKLKEVLAFHGIDPKGFEGAILSSVVPPVTEALAKAVEQMTGKHCMVVGPGMKTGLNVAIDDPGTLGADLVVGSVAAMTYYGTPAIVIDLGTATTVMAIDQNGCYRGGAIMPGVKLSFDALSNGTSLLPVISITPPPKVVATNTVDAMRSGAVFSTAAALDGMIDRMEEELGYPCKLIATGGLAQAIVPHCRREIICDDDLLLKGLWALYVKNRKA